MVFLLKPIIFRCGRMVWGAETASCLPLKQHLWSFCIGPIYGPLGGLFNCTSITTSSPRHCCSPRTAWTVRASSLEAPKLLPGRNLPQLGPTLCPDLAHRLLCLGLSTDPTTSPALPVPLVPGGDCGAGERTSHLGPSELPAPLPSQAAWLWLLPDTGSTLWMPLYQEPTIHSTSTVWITDNFKLQREEKYLAKLCNWGSKIAYCHLVVLFWRPKTPQVFLKLAILFANSAKFFTKSRILHAWFTSGVFWTSCACAQAIPSHTAPFHVCHTYFKSPVTFL